MLYAARAASLAANAHVLAAYAGALWPPLDGPLTIIVTIGAITLVNIVGIRRAVDTLGGMTMIKLMPLILIGALGLLLAPIPAPTLPRVLGGRRRGAGRALCVRRLRGRDHSRRRNARPRAQTFPVRCCLPSPASPCSMWSSSSPIRHRASAKATRRWPILPPSRSGPAGALILGITAIVSVLANQLSAVTSISRITSSFADQGLLPRWFGKISPRFATPGKFDPGGRRARPCAGPVGDLHHPGGDQHRVAAVRLSRLHRRRAEARLPGRQNPLGPRHPAALCRRRAWCLWAASHSKPGGMAGVRRIPRGRRIALSDRWKGPEAGRNDDHRRRDRHACACAIGARGIASASTRS